MISVGSWSNFKQCISFVYSIFTKQCDIRSMILNDGKKNGVMKMIKTQKITNATEVGVYLNWYFFQILLT